MESRAEVDVGVATAHHLEAEITERIAVVQRTIVGIPLGLVGSSDIGDDRRAGDRHAVFDQQLGIVGGGPDDPDLEIGLASAEQVAVLAVIAGLPVRAIPLTH